MRTSTTAAAAAVAATTTTPEGCTALEWRKVWQAWLFIPRPDVKGRTYTLHTPLLSKSTLRPAAPPSLSTNPPETDIIISGQSFLSSRRDIKNPLLSRPSKRARYTTPSLSLSLFSSSFVSRYILEEHGCRLSNNPRRKVAANVDVLLFNEEFS